MMLQKHSSKGKYTLLLTLNLQLTIKHHPRLPHSQMVVQHVLADRHIPFLQIMFLFVASNPLGIQKNVWFLTQIGSSTHLGYD